MFQEERETEGMDQLSFYTAPSKFQDLQIRYCGIEKCDPMHSYGPAVRDSYLIHIVLGGSGTYQVDQHTYHLGAGEGFLIEPGVQTFYRADQEDPWTYIWLGFQGTLSKRVITELGLGKGNLTFRCGCMKELRMIIMAMMQNRSSSKSEEYENQSLIYRFIAVLLSDMEINIAQNTGRNLLVHNAVACIEENYTNAKLKVTDIAKTVNIERGYLYSLFKKHLDMSPQEYLTRFRLTRAVELLTYTDESMDMISMKCGYQDPVIFSKAFKKMYGVPPTKYRQKNRANMRKTIEEGAGRLSKILE